MKKLLKFIIPLCILRFISILRMKPMFNYFKREHKKNALLSYITAPFKTNSFSHTNYFEAQSWAKILDELGYNVDIIDYRNTKKIDLSKYDLICGFGDVFQHLFEDNYKKNIKSMYYGAGMHVCHQNTISLQRVKDVYYKKGIWLGTSARFVEKTWTHQTSLVDGIIALGNHVCAESYRRYYDGNVYELPAPYYQTQDGIKIIESRNQDSLKHYLWFGSSGLIHKGLDLVLDYFSQHDDIYLHVCGAIDNEPYFVNAYQKELFESKNIIIHGFIDISSDKFKEILQKCSFIIYPSCSEGGSPSTLTVIGNGGLIPIITKETSIHTGHEIWIEGFKYSDIDHAIKQSKQLSFDEIREMQYKNYEFVTENHSQKKYYLQLKESIQRVINEM